MKPFTEYLNDKLVEASQNVLSGNTNSVVKNNIDNAKAVRAAKRERELLKTREKSLADKRKRAGLTGGSPIKFVEASSDELSALSKVMLSMGVSYGDINAVRSKLDSEVSGKFLIALATIIANDTSAFNAFVKAQSK